MLKKVISEFGINWILCRVLYSTKLILLRRVPAAERLFEHKVDIRRLNILTDNTAQIECFIKSLPSEIQQSLLQIADHACEGTIKGFSSVKLSYGLPINWQLNPLTNKTCDSHAKWYQIPDFDRERGDIKVVWEISRFSHFITLARAYLVSEDKKYYEAFREQLSAWLEKNPYSYGANFKCGQECALRMMNALLAYNVFHFKGVTNEEDKRNLFELISRCYRKIISNVFYAHRCIKNNHTISELAGMIIGAWCTYDIKRLKRAYKILDNVIAEQFSNDGGYTQFSLNYQRMVFQVLEYVFYVSKRTGISLSDASVERIKNSILLLYQCQDSIGDVPNYGSNDGALVFPVSASGYRDFRPVLGSLYGMLFKKRLFDRGIYDEEALWFGENLEQFSEANERRVSAAFPDAGLFTMREEHFWMMIVLNDYKKRPAHMDQLHIDLWVDGINVLCDCGTYSYADRKGEALVLTEAHNTAKVDGIEQMNKMGAFFIYNWTNRCAFKKSDSDFIGRMRSQNGYIHERRIKQRKNGLDIFDTLEAKKDVGFSLILHTPCNIIREEGRLLLFYRDRHILTIEGTLEIEVRDGIRSVYYLSAESISQICFKGRLKSGKAESLIRLDVIMNEEELA